MRAYDFGAIPLSLNRDEAALGYNAFAIAESGIDEWGNTLPLTFKSFGDYKLPGYIYTLVPLVKIFGLNEIIIRLPSLLAGIALIPLTFLFAKKLLGSGQKALWASAVVALSPWAIFYSRVAFEANLALAFFIGCLLFFSARQSILNTFLGSVLYGLAIITYNTPLMLMPIVFLMIFRNATPKSTKLIQAVIILSIGSIWLLSIRPLIAQKAGITIMSDPTIEYVRSTARSNSSDLISKFIYAKPIYKGWIIIKNILDSLGPEFLIVKSGSNPWHAAPHSGVISLTAYSLAVISVWQAFKKRDKIMLLLVSLIAISLAPAVVTVDAPHVTRSLFVLIILPIIGAYIYPFKKKTLSIVLAIFLLIETGWYAKTYFLDFPNNHSATWQVGLKEMIGAASMQFPEKIINITTPQNQPYIYVLLYQKIKPEEFLATVEYYGKDSAGLEYVKSFGRWSFIGDPKDVPANTPIIHQDQNSMYHLQ